MMIQISTMSGGQSERQGAPVWETAAALEGAEQRHTPLMLAWLTHRASALASAA